MLRHQQRISLVVIAAVAFGAGLAQAQPGGGGRGGRGGQGFGGIPGGPMGGIIGLVGNPAVHKEIGLEGEAVDKVQKVVGSFREEMMSAMQEAGMGFGGPGGGGPGGGGLGQLQDLKPEERQAKMREMGEKRNEIMKKLNDKFMPQLKEILTAPQAERLQQINWQVAGSGALAGPELGKSLELTKEQQEKITGINQEFQKKQQELGGVFGRGGGGGERMQKVQELGKERDAKAIEVLSSEQQEKYAKLKGKPFDVAQLQMGPGVGGGRGGGFGGGRGGPGGGPGAGPGGGPGGRPRGAAGRPQNKEDKKE